MKRIIIILMLLCGFACTKEEVTPREYPRVLTKEVVEISNGGAVFKGEITFNSVEILDYGFLWTTTGFPSLINTYSDRKSFGTKDGIGSFEWKIDQGLQPGKAYTMCAYARSSKHIVYGKTIDFVSK